jgi:hypothetical protein
MTNTPDTAASLLDEIGRDRIKARLGVADRVLQLCAQNNQFAASWYAALSDMAGRELPRRLFNFKGLEAAE